MTDFMSTEMSKSWSSKVYRHLVATHPSALQAMVDSVSCHRNLASVGMEYGWCAGVAQKNTSCMKTREEATDFKPLTLESFCPKRCTQNLPIRNSV